MLVRTSKLISSSTNRKEQAVWKPCSRTGSTRGTSGLQSFWKCFLLGKRHLSQCTKILDSHTLMKANKRIINIVASYGAKHYSIQSSRFFRGNKIKISSCLSVLREYCHKKHLSWSYDVNHFYGLVLNFIGQEFFFLFILFFYFRGEREHACRAEGDRIPNPGTVTWAENQD